MGLDDYQKYRLAAFSMGEQAGANSEGLTAKGLEYKGGACTALSYAWIHSYLNHKDIAPTRRVQLLKDDFVNIVALHLKYINKTTTSVDVAIANGVRELFATQYPQSPFKNYTIGQIARVSQGLDAARAESETSTVDISSVLKDLPELVVERSVSTTVSTPSSGPKSLGSLAEKAAGARARKDPILKELIAKRQIEAGRMHKDALGVVEAVKKRVPTDDNIYRLNVKDSTDKYGLVVSNCTIQGDDTDNLIPGKVGTCYVVRLIFMKGSGHAIVVADESTAYSPWTKTRTFDPNLGEYLFESVGGKDQENFLNELMIWYNDDYGYDGFRAHPVTKVR